MAELQMATKEFGAAAESLRRALALKPDDLEAQRLSIALDVQRKRIPEAIATAKAIQKQRPKESAGYLLEGDVHAVTKSSALAIAAYRAGLKQVDSADLAVRLHAALRINQREEADKFAADRLKKHPSQTGFRLYLAESSLATGDYARAMEHYKALLAIQPDNPKYLNNLAFAAGRLNDPQALEYAERAMKLDPNDPLIMDTVGVLALERGDVGRGLELLKKATTLAPQVPNIRLNLAKGLIKAGQKSAARTELETLAKLGSRFGASGEVDKLLREL